MCHCPKPVCTLYRIGYTYILQWDANGKLLETFPTQNKFFSFGTTAARRAWCVAIPNLFTHLFLKKNLLGLSYSGVCRDFRRYLPTQWFAQQIIFKTDYLRCTFLGSGSTVLIRFSKLEDWNEPLLGNHKCFGLIFKEMYNFDQGTGFLKVVLILFELTSFWRFLR